ncbi:Vacuolar protein sorting-associated protein 62 [Ophiocordyceps sinensis CO18]|uniref:Vacuolar protein sorting-associated protein 62 n=1 Tax=Ophiocordyceps sinensis (strain Co18 / CGMCC 3.14243) TaxID=911162 RepID=T5AKX3_OPHSC|nr:Vacuolar protein sorting-associated protein 62 [Ophiocordyceps sinensis CO18]
MTTPASRSVMMGTPVAQGNMRPLGSVAIGSGFYELGGKRASLLVGNSSQSSSAVASPVGWRWLWNTKGGKGKHDSTVWRPIAPSGYVALGDVVKYHWDEPDKNSIWCLRADLVGNGTFASSDIWNDRGSGGSYDISCWAVLPRDVGTSGSELIPTSADTFRFSGTYSQPDISLAQVPVLRLPKAFQRFTSSLPQVTPSTIPSEGDIFSEMEQCRATLPFTTFFDPTSRQVLDNLGDPFCTVIKSIAWDVQGVWVNNSGASYDRTQTIKYGVSREKREEMVNSVGVEITAEAGIKAVSYSVSLNYQFTYSTSSSFTEYSEKQVEEKLSIPAHEAVVLFTKHLWVTGQRADGSQLSRIEVVANDDVHFGGCKLN